jgi:predicted nucleic acid-binding protein
VRRPRRRGAARNADVPRSAFVDSGAFIALASADDAHHADAEAVLRRALEHRTRLFTTHLALAGVHRLLLFRAGIRAAQVTLASISSSPSIAIEPTSAPLHDAALRWIDQLQDQPITYTDAVGFALMRAKRCEAAITFDRHFAVAGFRVWRA